MRYLPLTTEEKQKILDYCGEKSFETLTREIPESLRLKGPLNIPAALSESELLDHINQLGEKNSASAMTCLIGQGAYDHTWPVVIDYLMGRGEFLTAYTPYQPEISQGTLQVIFEFQSMIAELMGMEVSNASLYDGSTALVEAVLMAARLQNKTSGTIVVAEGVYEQSLAILKTYLLPLGFDIAIWRADENGCSVPVAPAVPNPVAVVMQSPNKWGVVENWSTLKQVSDSLGVKSVAHVAHPHSVALYASPGDKGIDLASSEGQSLGIPLGFGGPYLGLFTCAKKDVRQMPGRLVGKTVDSRGRRSYCVTLSTREQHIRREKATSNICSNQSLMALRAAIFMSLMGPQGMSHVAQLSHQAAEHTRKSVKKIVAPFSDVRVNSSPIFNEWSLFYTEKYAPRIEALQLKAQAAGILLGAKIKAPEQSGFAASLTLAFTERFKKADADKLEKLFAEVFV